MLANFSRASTSRGEFSVAHFTAVRAAIVAASVARHLHTKLSRVTVIFFLL